MSTCAAILDDAQRFLRDAGRLWARAELLRWLLDGYRKLLAQSQSVRQFTVLPLPPRHTVSHTFLWEKDYTLNGTSRLVGLRGPTGHGVYTSAWEIEAVEHVASPAVSFPMVTQLWELAFIEGQQDAPYRVALPRSHERICGVWWDHKRLSPVSVRELDELEDSWQREAGEPWWWVPGFGEFASFEIYEIRDAYHDTYARNGELLLGMPRALSPGDRTYTTEARGNTVDFVPAFTYTHQGEADFYQSGASPLGREAGQRITAGPTPGGWFTTFPWEAELEAGEDSFTTAEIIGTAAWEKDYGATNFGAYSLGMIRRWSSPERQYLPQKSWEPPLGIVRDIRSSANALLVWEAIVEQASLTEEETPSMLPAPLHKYLRYYVLSMAYNRQGEGYEPALAEHWRLRWERGLALLRRMHNTTWADSQYQREPSVRGTRRIPVPQMPPEFARTPWYG